MSFFVQNVAFLGFFGPEKVSKSAAPAKTLDGEKPPDSVRLDGAIQRKMATPLKLLATKRTAELTTTTLE